MMESQDKYNTPEWKKRSLSILKRDNFVCQICGRKANQTHHIFYYSRNIGETYEHPELAKDEDLISLCKSCHSIFSGTRSCDYVFLRSLPRPLLVRRTYYDNLKKKSNFPCIPQWEEIKEVLRKINLAYDYNGRNSLRLAMLCPYLSHTTKSISEVSHKCSELNNYLKLNKYDFDEMRHFLDFLKRESLEYPSATTNYKIAIDCIEQKLINSKEKPKQGIIVESSMNKKKGYWIKLFDIASSKEVFKKDYSNCDYYKNAHSSHGVKLSLVYAILYLMKNYQRFHQEKIIQKPIFMMNPNGMDSIITLLLTKENMNFNNHDGLKKIISVKFNEIDLSKIYIITKWQKKEWGESPCCT